MATSPDFHMNRNGYSQPQDWKSWLFKQGVTTVLLVILAWWVATYLLIPMRDDQRDFMKAIIKTNEMHAAAAVTYANTLSGILDTQKESVRTQQQNTSILSQIRDDQRKFPAVAERHPN